MNKTYKINYSWRPIYFQALQLIQAFFTNPETPNMAVILCLLSRGNNSVDSQRELRKWLYKEEDERREKVLSALGLRIVRFGNDEVVRNLSAVVERIKESIEK